MLVISLVAACVDAPGESTTSAEVIAVNRISLNRISLNRISLNRISLNRISLNRISAGRLSVNLTTAGELLATEDGREVFSLAVSCAMPDDITLVATIDGTDFEFPGELGLAPQWMFGRLNHDGQGWVSACMFARVNAHEVAIPISLRGPTRALQADADERAGWTLEEGAFYGNLFGSLDQPIQWFACQGRDQAAGETGGLVDRDCAEPDPANPGFTQCGFIYTGNCFGPDAACATFSTRGTFYRQCRTSSSQDELERGDHRVVSQIITTFVTP